MTQMRVSEAAELLGVSPDTVRRSIEAGRLPATKDEAGRTGAGDQDRIWHRSSPIHAGAPNPSGRARLRLPGHVLRTAP